MKIQSLSPLLLTSLASLASGASPVLNSIMPRGGQIGTDVAITMSGARLEDTEEVASASPEVKVTGFKVEAGDKVTCTLHLEPNCPLGEHLLRIRTKSGLTYARTFWAGQFPSLAEVEPNTQFETAQVVTMGNTLTGVIENEDVDYFKVTAKKGERISVELEGIRLGTVNMDPYVAILDSKRFELGTCDDSSLLMQDPFVSVIAPEDDTYYIEVRDASYVGNGGYNYRVHLGNFPRPSMVYPLGGKAGTEVTVKYLGDVSGPIEEKVAVPATPGQKLRLFAKQNNFSAPSPNWFRVSTLDNALEVEPNNSLAEAAAKPESPALPYAFNGIIEKAADEDWHKFSAKKDQKFDFVVFARSLRSPLDAVLEIFNKDGGALGANDDNGASPDCKLPNWTCPADGDYYLRVRDHLSRGGADFVYRVEVNAAQPELNAYVTRQDRNDTQLRTMMIVPRGNTIATPVTVDRINLGGDVAFAAADLPAGVTLNQVPLPGNINQYVLAFSAAADAPLGVKLTHITPQLTDPKTPFIGRWTQNIEWVQGEPNNTPYYSTMQDTMPICVVDEMPFTLAIVPPSVPAVQSGNMDLKVVATRKAGFTKPITVRMLWNPNGISSPGNVAIPEGANECIYQINVGGGTEAKVWNLAVTGDTDAGAGPIAVSSPLCPVTVAPPYVTMKIEMGAVEQGKTTELLCKLEHPKPFTGKAKLTLYGLPNKATSTDIEIDPGQAEVRFPIVTAPETPVGKHPNLFVNLVVMENGAPIPHIVGQGGVLRVDAPPPAPPPAVAAAPAAPAAEAAPAAPAAPKVLSRLEQLRQQAAGK